MAERNPSEMSRKGESGSRKSEMRRGANQTSVQGSFTTAEGAGAGNMGSNVERSLEELNLNSYESETPEGSNTSMGYHQTDLEGSGDNFGRFLLAANNTASNLTLHGIDLEGSLSGYLASSESSFVTVTDGQLSTDLFLTPQDSLLQLNESDEYFDTQPFVLGSSHDGGSGDSIEVFPYDLLQEISSTILEGLAGTSSGESLVQFLQADVDYADEQEMQFLIEELGDSDVEEGEEGEEDNDDEESGDEEVQVVQNEHEVEALVQWVNKNEELDKKIAKEYGNSESEPDIEGMVEPDDESSDDIADGCHLARTKKQLNLAGYMNKMANSPSEVVLFTKENLEQNNSNGDGPSAGGVNVNKSEKSGKNKT